MVRIMPRATVVAAVIMAAASTAGATPYALPQLGLTIELPASPSWSLDGSSDGLDRLDSQTTPSVRVEVARAAGGCAEWAATVTTSLGDTDQGRFMETPTWAPATWYPATATALRADDTRVMHLCRDLDVALGEPTVLVVLAQAPSGADAGSLAGSVLAALEVQLLRNSVPAVRYETPGVVLVTTFNLAIDERRGVPGSTLARHEVVPPADDRPAAAAYQRRDEPSADRPRRPGRYEGVRLTFDLAKLALEGDRVDGGRVGVALALPARYRRRGADKGWAYGGRLAAGRAGDVLVGSGHGAIGLAIGMPHTQLALLMVVGGDRAPAGSPLTTQDGGFAGLEAMLRMPVTQLTVIEASGTMVAGSHGRGTWLELSLASVRCAPVTCLLGIERRTWDDGMSSLGAQLGIGY